MFQNKDIIEVNQYSFSQILVAHLASGLAPRTALKSPALPSGDCVAMPPVDDDAILLRIFVVSSLLVNEVAPGWPHQHRAGQQWPPGGKVASAADGRLKIIQWELATISLLHN